MKINTLNSVYFCDECEYEEVFIKMIKIITYLFGRNYKAM